MIFLVFNLRNIIKCHREEVFSFIRSSVKHELLNIECKRSFFKVTVSCPYHALRVYPFTKKYAVKSMTLADIHTIKGWKTIARSGQKFKEGQNSEELKARPTACEEGKSAVPHDLLFTSLQNCYSVPEQIETFCSLVSMTSEEIENRKKFCQDLTDICRPYFSYFKVHLFGSSINGLGFRGCDVDVSIQTIPSDDETQGYVTMSAVPTLDDLLQGRVSSDSIARMNPRYLLRFVRRILRQHCSDINGPIILVKARCPILRFYNQKYDLFCDFSCENKFSLQNTKLLRFITHLDDRFIPLAKILRYWGKYAGFVGDIDMFNSYSFSLLVIYFLQNTSPPVLPPINEMLSKSEYLTHGDINDEAMLLQDIKQFQPSQNKKTTEELLKDFFLYFLLYDFSRAMLPLTSSSVPKFNFKSNEEVPTDTFELSTVCVQDPFRRSFNATFACTFESCRRFMNSLVYNCKVTQDETLSVPRNVSLWGISSLFYPPISEAAALKDWKKNLIHKIEVPVKSVSEQLIQAVKNILEYGLLFKCNEIKTENFNIRDNNSTEKVFLKLNCQAYHNSWQGRNQILKDNFENSSIYDPLELEHSISEKLMKDKTYSTKQMLSQFQCECTEHRRQNKTYLIVTLTFQESKFPPIVAIFLKEYIPYVLKKMLY